MSILKAVADVCEVSGGIGGSMWAWCMRLEDVERWLGMGKWKDLGAVERATYVPS